MSHFEFFSHILSAFECTRRSNKRERSSLSTQKSFQTSKWTEKDEADLKSYPGMKGLVQAAIKRRCRVSIPFFLQQRHILTLPMMIAGWSCEITHFRTAWAFRCQYRSSRPLTGTYICFLCFCFHVFVIENSFLIFSDEMVLRVMVDLYDAMKQGGESSV